MGKELKEHGEFRDDNNQQWDIGVYQHDDGVQKFSTVVRSPEGVQYTPEEDFLGEYHLIDKQGTRHNDDLPMNMEKLQVAVEAVEDVASGRKDPNAMRAEKEAQQWDETQAVQDTEEKTSWRDRIKEGLSKARSSGGPQVGG